MEERILSWLAMLVWATTQDLADALGVHRTTALRHLQNLESAGLVAFRRVGRDPYRMDLWILTAEGVYRMFPNWHFHQRGRTNHRHDPRDPEIPDHYHPSYWNGEEGARELLGKLQQVRYIYPVAINLFKGTGSQWHPDGQEARLLSFRWLQGGRLIVAVGEYEGGLRIFFCWVPVEYTEQMLVYRWDRLSDDLIAEVDRKWGAIDWMTKPVMDNNDDPQASGYVLLAEDPGAFDLAWAVLKRRGRGLSPLFRVCMYDDENFKEYRGRVAPTYDNIWDPPTEIVVGAPERLCLPLNCQDEEGDQDGR